MKDHEIVTVVRAQMDEEPIERRPLDSNNSWELHKSANLNFLAYEYRIKPEPFEQWVNVYAMGVNFVHDSKKQAVAEASITAKRIAVHMVEVDEQGARLL